MNNTLEVEIFRSGDYGPRGAYTDGDLDNIVADYDPRRHEAPVTLDHKTSGPAYGWVASLQRRGDTLVAHLRDLSDEFLQWLRDGAYKKRSVELYKSFAPTGRPYLRALSFLGACPPEIKGLADPVFAEEIDTPCPVENFIYEESELPEPKSENQNVHSVQPVHSVHDLPETPSPADPFASRLLPQASDELARLREENAALTTRLSEHARTRRAEQLSRFRDEARRAGRWLPAWDRLGIAAFAESLDESAAINFSEPSASASPISSLNWFLQFMETLPPVVEFSEFAPAPHTAFSAPLESLADASIDPASLRLHREAQRLCAGNPDVTYTEALRLLTS